VANGAPVENIATASLTVFALALTLIALRAWRFSGSRKVLLLAAGFALFFAKGLVLSLGLFVVPDWEELLLPSVLFDLSILTVFYLAALKRGG